MKTNHKRFFYEVNYYCILGIIVTLIACSIEKKMTETPYKVIDVYQSANTCVHRLVTLSGSQYRDIYLDSIFCNKNDTIIIKDYEKRLRRSKKSK